MRYLIGLFLAIFTIVIVVQAQPNREGRILDLSPDKLPRFKNPQKDPPKQKPPERKGGNWHWHPHHSWLWFPQNQAPRTFILEPTYRLPPRVTYYERPTVNYVICPHCGQTILLD